MSKAKFQFDASNGLIELSGSDDFVSKHLQSILDMTGAISAVSSQVTALKPKEVAQFTDADNDYNSEKILNAEVTELNNFPYVFSKDENGVAIICSIKGKSKKSEMRNAALLYCYGCFLDGKEPVSSKDIRSVCEEHGVLDGKNFASCYGDKTLFISNGVKGGVKDVKLTMRGKEKAKELAVDITSKN